MTLQQQWDIWLCATFVKMPNMRMEQSINFFADKMKMSAKDVWGARLKRFPEGFSAQKATTTRFVCGYIKGAANIMLGDGNPIQMSLKLAKLESSKDEIDKLKRKLERNEIASTQRAFRLGNDEYALGRKQREAYGRKNWSACK